MKAKVKIFAPYLAALLFGTACNNASPEAPQTADTPQSPEVVEEVSQEVAPTPYLALLEIPVTNIDRAIGFYASILDLEIEKMEMPGMEMGIFPYEGRATNAVLMKGEGYVPSAEGVTPYLNAGDDLQPVLDKVEAAGGTIILPKTAHADESGFFALILDSEGNKMGLNSPH